MARVPMVTRTINTTKATVLCLNIATSETLTKEIVAPRTYKNDTELLKTIKPIIEAEENIKAVHVVATEVIESLYGMSEQEFIANAQILPARKHEEVVEN